MRGRQCSLGYVRDTVHGRRQRLGQRGTRTLHADKFCQETAKKRTRRTVKQQRGVVGASLDVIKERRAQRPEARRAARDQAIKEGKEKKAAAESKKKADKAKTAAGAARGNVGSKVSKLGSRGTAPKVQANTR